MRRLLTFILCIACFIIPLNHSSVFASPVSLPPHVPVEGAYYVVDVGTGMVLYSQEEDVPLAVAQLTQWMTLLLLMEALDEEELQPTDLTNVSEYAAALSDHLGKPLLKEGEEVTIEALWNLATVLQNPGAWIALVEHWKGSEEAFVELMNERAEKMKLEHTRFVNATGLKNSELHGHHPKGTGADDESLSTVRGIGQVMYAVMKRDPSVLEGMRRPSIVWKKTTYVNVNEMLEGRPYAHDYVSSAWYGSSALAGQTMALTAQKGKRHVLIVAKMSPENNPYELAHQRLGDWVDWAFSTFKEVELVGKHEPVVSLEHLPVNRGKKKDVAVVTKEAITALVLADSTSPPHPTFEPTMDVPLQAPFKKGEAVGTVILQPELSYGFINEQALETTLIATEDVPLASLFTRGGEGFLDFWKEWWQSIDRLYH
ncbi:hypothetical protein GOP80_01405 [Planococcaceae bacterium Storch 2/2-2]|nr:hypothetical protein [Planococcaceae bacterium Storch 2/2-2]